MSSENFDQIVRLSTLLNCNYELSIEVAEIDNRISTNTRHLKYNRHLDDLNRRACVLNSNIKQLQERSSDLLNSIQRRRTSLIKRRRHLCALQEAENSQSIPKDTPSQKINHLSPKAARSHLLNHLISLFPILNTDDSFTFSILGLELENPNPIISSSALGYTSLLTQILSSYLNIHLPYQIVYKGSHSYIIDSISNIRGNNSFPLHYNLKNDHRYRLEYAIYLFNKNIQVLMLSYDLPLPELGHILANMKNLLLILSS
ncbi:hypothetical protein E3P96_03221 [Wallemia ichthyophaga]|nr:hypothetical protein E3P96_03221 [Wallemia ichthyophaga]